MPTPPTPASQFITVTHGLRGYFAVLMDDQGPIDSGLGSFLTPEAAGEEAQAWAAAEGLPYHGPRATVAVPTPAYAGIGSRQTPEPVLAQMRAIAARLATLGYVLRSGAADGADTAFEQGARAAGGRVEVYLPWSRFAQRDPAEPGLIDASSLPCASEAAQIAQAHHPAWEKMRRGAQALHARNAHQILGADLASPVRFVVCWAPDPQVEEDRVVNVRGGTGLAVRLAHARGIPVFHLGLDAHRARIDAWLAKA
jgi:hypothetical protein